MLLAPDVRVRVSRKAEQSVTTSLPPSPAPPLASKAEPMLVVRPSRQAVQLAAESAPNPRTRRGLQRIETTAPAWTSPTKAEHAEALKFLRRHVLTNPELNERERSLLTELATRQRGPWTVPGRVESVASEEGRLVVRSKGGEAYFAPPLLDAVVNDLVAHTWNHPPGASDFMALSTKTVLHPGPHFRGEEQLRAIDSELAAAIGESSWSAFKANSVELAQLIDATSDRAGLPPEGVHPKVAAMARPLVFAASGFQKDVDTRAADTRLAELLESVPASAVPGSEQFLRDLGVRPELAPRAYAVIGRRSPEPPPALIQLIDAVAQELARVAGATGRDARLAELDRQIAEQLTNLPALSLPRGERLLVDQSVLLMNRGLSQPRGGALGQLFPETIRAAEARHFRRELLEAELASDPQFRELVSERDELKAQLVMSTAHDATRGPLREVLARHGEAGVAALVEWGQREHFKLLSLEEEAQARSERARENKPEHLRTAREVFLDHLELRRLHQVPLDLERNYAKDVLLHSNNGTFQGRQAINDSAANLARLLPTDAWAMERLYFSENAAYEIWTAWYEGKLVTGFDAFHIEDGQIQAKIVHSGDPGNLLAAS